MKNKKLSNVSKDIIGFHAFVKGYDNEQKDNTELKRHNNGKEKGWTAKKRGYITDKEF